MPVRRAILFCPVVLLVLVHLAQPASATTRGTLPNESVPHDSLEISVSVGVAGGGTFSGWRDDDGLARGDLPLDSGASLGAAFAWGSLGRRVLELSWTHLSVRADERNPPVGVEPFGLTVSLDDWQIEGGLQWGPFRGRHRLRAGLLLGLTRIDSNNILRWRPTLGLGAGSRTRLGGRWVVRTHLRLRTTHTGSDDPVLCKPSGACIAFGETDWIGRWELGMGLAFLL